MPCFDGRFVDCHSVLSSKFSNIKSIGRGSNGMVLSAVEKAEGKLSSSKVALKRLSLRRKSHCRSALRELRILKRLDHENIVKNHTTRTPNGCEVNDFNSETLKDLDYVYLVEELLDTDLHNIIDRTGKLSEKIAKLFLYQLLRGLKYIHSANVVHRDVKPGNLFVNVDDLVLKIGDFGLGRIVDPKFEHAGHLTELVTTRYYRAPEVILSPGNYDSSMDIWSTGCVFAEMCTGNVLFPGDNDLSQIDCIRSWFQADANTSGRFQAHKLAGFSQAGLDFLQKMLRLEPSKRPTAAQLLEDPYFGDISDPADEPVCPVAKMFHIEHEVDDLPIEVLRNMIASECSCKRSNFNKEIFQDFDEDFRCESSESQSLKCPQKEDFNPSLTYDRETRQMSQNSPFGCGNDVCPSLSNVIDASFVDEPFRDPACCEAMTSEYDCETMTVESVSTEHCSPNFPKTSSSMLDLNFPKAASMLDMSKCINATTVECRRALEISCPATSYQKTPRNLFHHKGLERDILNMSNFGGHGLPTRRSCRVAEFSATEHRGSKFRGHFNHWDPIRIWI